MNPEAKGMSWIQMAVSPVDFARESLGLKLDAQQERLLGEARQKVILNCARQWGKSTMAAAMAVWRALCQDGCLVLMASPSRKQSGEFVRKVEGFLRRLEIPVRRYNQMGDSVLLPNGSRIVGLPANEATSRGFSGAVLVMIDEAARMSEDMYAAVTPSMCKEWPELWYMSTPKGREGTFYKTWMDTADQEWLRLRVPATECARYPKEYLERMRKGLNERKFAQEYLCQFGDLEGALFRGEWIERAMKKDFGAMEFWRPGHLTALLPMHVDVGRGQRPKLILAIDIGRDGNPSAIVIIELTVRELGLDKTTYMQALRKVFRVRWLEKIPLGTPYMDVVRRVKELVATDALKGRCDVVVDATGVGGPIVELLREAKMGCAVVELVITSGQSDGGEGMDRKVPRKNLLYGLERALSEEELEVAASLEESGALAAEMAGVRVKGKTKGADDLTMALAMGVWWGRKGLRWK